MNILAKIVFGSKLYGTNVPTSDNDFRAIYLPTLEECVLLRARDAWEDKSEEDTSFFSLQHFLKMAQQGQSAAIELLCAGPEYRVLSSPFFEELHKNRNQFFSKNMNSFIGYARAMSGKYTSRVDRLNEAEAIVKFLEENQFYEGEIGMGKVANRLSDVWEGLPVSPNATKGENPQNKNVDKRAYFVCGRELQATVTTAHAIDVIKQIVNTYGERVRKAKSAELDYKALMHAFRAGYQVKQIMETGDLKFPLPESEYLRDMRSGKINFVDNNLDEKLDDLMVEVQGLIDKSDLPDRVDTKIVDDIILKAYSLN